MNSPGRRKLQELYKEKVKRAIADAQIGTIPPDELKNDIEQIDRYARLLKLTESRFTAEAGFAVAVAMASLLLAAYLWSHKVSRTSIPRLNSNMPMTSMARKGDISANSAAAAAPLPARCPCRRVFASGLNEHADCIIRFNLSLAARSFIPAAW